MLPLAPVVLVLKAYVWREKTQRREVEGRQAATGRKSEDLEERRMCES